MPASKLDEFLHLPTNLLYLTKGFFYSVYMKVLCLPHRHLEKQELDFSFLLHPPLIIPITKFKSGLIHLSSSNLHST